MCSVPAQCGIGQNRSHALVHHLCPNGLSIFSAFKPAGVPEFDGQLEFTRPCLQVPGQLFSMARHELGCQLNEGGAELVAQSQKGLNKIVGWAFAVVELSVPCNNCRKLGAEFEAFGHGVRPDFHALRRVDLVMRRIEL